MRTSFLPSIVLTLTLLLPLTLACHTWYGGVNVHATGQRFYYPLGKTYLPDGTGPLPIPEGSVWEETNGLGGFQCETTVRGDGVVFPPDTRII